MDVLVQIDAWDPAAQAPVALRAGSRDAPEVCHALDATWWPCIGKLPALRYDFFDGAFGDQITAPSSSLTIQTEPWPEFGRYSLPDARFKLWTRSAAEWVLRFDGRVTEQPEIADGAADLQFAVDDRWLDKALLATYAGTTGAEGPVAMAGQIKPMALGAPRYVPGQLIDSVNSVFQVTSYGPLRAFDAALDRLVRFGPPVANYASYDALVAATIAPGEWATATTVGMARFGAPPAGKISFLVQGELSQSGAWARRPGQLIRRIATLAGASDKIDSDSLLALDVARPYNLSLYLDAQTTAREIIQRIAASVNAVAVTSWLGKLHVLPVGIGSPSMTLAADGSSLPPVSGVKQIGIASPWQRLSIGAERTWAVHALSEIAFAAELIPMGLFKAGTTYREGNIVSLEDGSTWLYVATTPAAGHVPPKDAQPDAAGDVFDAWWFRQAPPTVASSVPWSGVIDDDGNKPEDGATVGAPPGTNIGTRPVEEVLDQIDEAAETIAIVDEAVAVASADAAGARSEAATARSDAAAARTDLAAEVERAKGAEGTLSSSVSQAQSDASGALSRITTEETNRANADSALANRLTTVEARPTGGGNLLPNTDFPTLDGWVLTASLNGVMALNGAGDNWHPVGANALTLVQQTPVGAGLYMEALSPVVPVKPGDWLQAYAFTSSHRSQAWVTIFFYDANGTGIGYAGEHSAERINAGGLDLGQWDQTGVKSYQVPPGTVSARLALRKYDTHAGEPNSYGWFIRPYLGYASSGQTTWNPYSPGGSQVGITATLAKVTEEVTARTNAVSAIANRTTTIEAQLGGTTDSGLRARIATEETTRATNDSALANRSSVLEASSRADPNMMNGNATFSDWPDSRANPNDHNAYYNIPKKWTLPMASPGAAAARMTGLVSKYALQTYWPGGMSGQFFHASTWTTFAGDDPSDVDPGMAGGPGTYIVECDVELISGSFGGSGLYLDAYTAQGVYIGTKYWGFESTVSNEGVAPGAGVVGRRYKFTVLHTINAQSTAFFRFHPMTAYGVFTGAQPEVTLRWHKVGIRKATTQEMAATESLARIGVEETVRANADSALANRTSVMEASSRVMGDSVVKNPRFAVWSNPSAYPEHWYTWQAGGNYRIERANSSTASPYVIRTLNDVVDADSGFMQQVLVWPGKWVMEATVESDISGLRGAGLTVNGVLNLDFLGTEDTNGYTGDAGNSLRTFQKVIDIGSLGLVNFHCMHSWGAYGRGSAPKYMYWVAANLRPATAADLANIKTNARIATEETVRANADSALANRTTTIEASALSGGNYMNANPSFAVWPEGQDLPTGWTWWQPTTRTRVARPVAEGGGYSVRLATGGGEAGFHIPNMYLGAGWYVMEADCEYHDGNTWVGSGLHLYNATTGGIYNLNFATEPDTNGVVGSGGVGLYRKFSKLVKLAEGFYNFHPMLQWGGFGSGGYKYMSFRFAGVRPATDGEIKAQKALTDVGTINARVAAEETARADGDSALAQRTTNVEARAGGLESRVTTTEAAVSDLGSKAASYWQVQAVAGNGRAQLRVWANANGGGGIDIVGDTTFKGSLDVGSDSGGNRVKITNNGITFYDANGAYRGGMGLKP